MVTAVIIEPEREAMVTAVIIEPEREAGERFRSKGDELLWWASGM